MLGKSGCQNGRADAEEAGGREYLSVRENIKDIEFEIRNRYGIEDFAAYWRGFRWKAPGKKAPKQASPRTVKGAACLLILCGAAITALSLQSWFDSVQGCVVGLLFMAVGILSAVRGVPEYPFWVQRAWKGYQKQQWTYFDVQFAGNVVRICSHNRLGDSDCCYSYSVIRQLWEDDGHFYIDMRPVMLCILQKSGFTQGSPQAFSGFIAEKTGKPVKWVDGAFQKHI